MATTTSTTTSTTEPVNPVTGGVTYGAGTGTTPAAGSASGPTTATTPAVSANTTTPAGPADLGINANPPPVAETKDGPVPLPTTSAIGDNWPTIPSSMLDQVLPGNNRLPVTPGQKPKQLDEKQLITEIASYEKIKSSKGQSLEEAVADTLAKKYGVQIQKTYQGTGNKQGEVGDLRHDIAAWFEDAHRDVAKAAVSLEPGKTLTDPTVSAPQNDTGNNPQPVQSKAALQKMLEEVAKKIPDGNAAHPLDTIAESEGQPAVTGGTPPGGGPQTVADAWSAFQSAAFSTNKSGQVTGLSTDGKQIASNLVNAGILTTDQATDPQAVAGGYAQVLTDSVKTGQSTTQIINAGVAQQASVGQAQDEWASYVGGVADEFGVALTQNQINDIATQYYNQAVKSGVTSVADGPSSETDAIKNAVVALYNPNNPNDPSGVASQIFQGIKSAALSYGIPLSDQQIGQYTTTALQGATVASMYVAKQSAIDSYTTLFQQQASSLYPTISSQIDAGIPTSTIVQPYNSLTQQYTGKDASAILTDPTDKYSAFLQGGKDPKTGAPTMMTLDQWKQTLMSDPQYGFQNTQGAKNLSSQFASAILNEFGKVNTGSSGQGAFSAIDPSTALQANS